MAIAINYDEPVQITPLVQRLTAPNPSLMTGPGTNTYIIGNDELVIIDPGPAQKPHIDTILNYCGDKLKWILVTHTHRDHSPAAYSLAEQTGAEVCGNLLSCDDGRQDTSFIPDVTFLHNECLRTSEFTLKGIHTPGHVDNHICFLLEEEGGLFTGDHIMQGSTVVIIPPSGDMSAYIDSLRLLLEYPINYLAPGHGVLIEEPKREVNELINHRLQREATVVGALVKHGGITIQQLVSIVYEDVPASLHKIALFSLHAHLIKLRDDGKVSEQQGLWQFN